MDIGSSIYNHEGKDMAKIALISCSKRKLCGTRPARRLCIKETYLWHSKSK